MIAEQGRSTATSISKPQSSVPPIGPVFPVAPAAQQLLTLSAQAEQQPAPWSTIQQCWPGVWLTVSVGAGDACYQYHGKGMHHHHVVSDPLEKRACGALWSLGSGAACTCTSTAWNACLPCAVLPTACPRNAALCRSMCSLSRNSSCSMATATCGACTCQPTSNLPVVPWVPGLPAGPVPPACPALKRFGLLHICGEHSNLWPT